MCIYGFDCYQFGFCSWWICLHENSSLCFCFGILPAVVFTLRATGYIVALVCAIIVARKHRALGAIFSVQYLLLAVLIICTFLSTKVTRSIERILYVNLRSSVFSLSSIFKL